MKNEIFYVKNIVKDLISIMNEQLLYCTEIFLNLNYK